LPYPIRFLKAKENSTHLQTTYAEVFVTCYIISSCWCLWYGKRRRNCLRCCKRYLSYCQN